MRARLRVLAVAASAVAGATSLVLPAGVPEASAADFYGGSASARAEAVRLQIDSPGAPASDRPVEFGFPSSSADVSGLEGSSATAALADPGAIVLNGPGLCKVVFPQCPDLPAYPFMVQSTYGTADHANAVFGPSTLDALSGPLTSTGSVTTSGGDPAQAGGQNSSISTGSLDDATGLARAQASTTTDSISFGDTLKIGSVHSVASVTGMPGKAAVREAGLEVKGLVIAGQSVGISQAGLFLGNSPTPLPAGNPLEQALAQAGITLRYLAGYNTADGIVAPALEIVAKGQMPGLPEPSILTVRLGYATAEVTAGQKVTAPSTALGHSPNVASPDLISPAPAGAGATTDSATSIPSADFAAALPAVGGLSVALPTVTIAGQPLDLPAVNNVLTARRTAAVLGTAPSDNARTMYLVLAVGAALAFVVTQLFGRRAARGER